MIITQHKITVGEAAFCIDEASKPSAMGPP